MTGDWPGRVDSTSPMGLRQWHHVAATFDYDTGFTQIFVNGSRENSGDSRQSEQRTQHNIRIGSRGHNDHR